MEGPTYRGAARYSLETWAVCTMRSSISMTESAACATIVRFSLSRFTGKERDTESGNDYFGARYYGSSMGRFMSPDPSGLVFASLANPQSLNLYAYAQNNPLIYTDPTGLDCAYLNNAGNGVESVDQQSNSGECGSNGGYWVDGGLTDININADAGTVQMTGTNDGTDTTHASYQDTNVFVDSWLNTSMNPPGHITIGLAGQQQVGQNPRSDADFLSN